MSPQPIPCLLASIVALVSAAQPVAGQSLRIPMRDGVVLAANLYRPAANQRFLCFSSARRTAKTKRFCPS
ncbi:MAG: hypothetical protein JNL98_41315 [Bryobacterales bacterium]|nr:hypothetical protein [Bryobacterales bacterium]